MKTQIKAIFARIMLVAVILTSGAFGVPVSEAEAATQSAYRWRNDDGSEATATYAEAQDVQAAIPLETPTRLRLGAANGGTEDELLESDVLELVSEGACKTPVIDATDTYLYCLSGARIMKVELSTFTLVETLTLALSTSTFNMGIDKSDGFLYVTEFTAPGSLIKVDLSDFTEVAELTLAFNGAASVVIDETGGTHYAYVGHSNGAVSKVDLSTFTAVGTVSAPNNLYSATIDAANDYAYFTAYASPCSVTRIRISDFTNQGTVTLESPGEANCRTSAIDYVDGDLYVPTETSRVVKIDLSTFTRTGFVSTSPTQFLNSIVIEPDGSFAYVGDDSNNPGKIVKIDLDTFSVVTTLTLNAVGERRLEGAAIDSTGTFAYFGVAFTPSYIIKIQTSDFTQHSRLAPDPGQSNLQGAAVIDAAEGYAYVGTYSSTPRVAKIDLTTFARETSIAITGVEDLISAAIDTTNGFAYFGTDETPANIVKIQLSDFTVADTLTLDAGEDKARSIVIDEAEGFAYVGTFTSPGKVVKIDLSTFTRVEAVTFPSGENLPRTAVIDVVDDFAYFGTLASTSFGGGATPGDDTYVVKVDIDPSNFARIGSIGLESQGMTALRTSVIDVGAGFAYFADQSGNIAKIGLSGFTYVGKITDSDNAYLASSVIDTANGFAYFGSNSTPVVYKIDLDSFTEVDKVSLTTGTNLFVAFIDSAKGYAYFGTNSNPADIGKVSIAPRARFRLEYGEKITSCAAISSWTQVPATATSEDWEMAASANITDGAATTDSAGLTNGNSSFQPGVIHDAVSQTAYISLGEKQFTELEFSVQATSNAADGDEYCFRLTDAGSATGFTYDQYAEALIGTGGTDDPTLSNAVTMTRLKVNTSSTVTISFELQNTLTGTFTATFPVGFSVTGAMTSGTCSGGGTVDTFAFNGGSRTMTAEKHSCAGTLTLSGGTVTTPSSPGLYFITWTNDDPGEGGVAIVDDDQVAITAQVDSTIAFDIDTAQTDTDTDAPYTVSLGTVTTTDTRVSGATDGIDYIWLDLDTNASAGAIVTVRNANGASGLVSTAVPGDTIGSTTGAVSDGVENYGLCSVSTSVAGGAFAAQSPFDGSCSGDTEGNTVGGFDGTAQTIYATAGGPVASGRAQIAVQASVSATTPAHNDYSDTLTFIATGTF